MNRFSCTRSLGEEIYHATLIAENEQQAREMALAETNKKFSKSGGRLREWSEGLSSVRPGLSYRLRLPRGVTRIVRA